MNSNATTEITIGNYFITRINLDTNQTEILKNLSEDTLRAVLNDTVDKSVSGKTMFKIIIEEIDIDSPDI